jgi:putative membrane protein
MRGHADDVTSRHVTSGVHSDAATVDVLIDPVSWASGAQAMLGPVPTRWRRGAGRTMTGIGTATGDAWTGVFWAFVVVGAGLLGYVALRLLAASRRSTSHGSERGGAPRATSEARRILEERLARGEIDAEEFSERLQALEGR